MIVDLLSLAGAKESRNVPSERLKTTPEDALGELGRTGKPLDVYSVPFSEPSMGDDISPPYMLSLVFDKPLGERLSFGQFIYPSNFLATKEYYYHILYTLDTCTNSISIRNTKRRANMVDYPIDSENFSPTDLLYEIIRVSKDYQELELRAKTPNPFSKTIKMERGQTGSWRVHSAYEGTAVVLFWIISDWLKPKD